MPVGLNGAPCGHFYPRSPYGERLKSVIAGTFRSLISIHALLTESDPPVKTVNVRGHDFYPRSPYGERRNAHPEIRRPYAISIHALLTESDSFAPNPKTNATISIHALLTESDAVSAAAQSPASPFLSTLSLRRATEKAISCKWTDGISIHALLTESDI